MEEQRSIKEELQRLNDYKNGMGMIEILEHANTLISKSVNNENQ